MLSKIVKHLASLVILTTMTLQAPSAFCTQTLAQLPNTQQAESENSTFTFAIVPQLPASTTISNWRPLLHHLSQHTGLNIQIILYKSFIEFETDIMNGKPDFVYMNPYHQVVAYQSQGYIPLIRDNSTQLIGILVVRKDSPIRSVRELEGKTIAFPSPNAFAASLYMRALLSEKEEIKYTSEYAVTHNNVYRNVALGLVDAGGGVNKTLEAESPDIREQLRVIYEIPGVAPHPISAHPRVSTQIREAVIRGLMEMATDNDGKAALKSVQLEHPVRADYKNDYLYLNTLHLNKYAQKYSPSELRVDH